MNTTHRPSGVAPSPPDARDAWFEYAPIPLAEQDLSALKTALDALEAAGCPQPLDALRQDDVHLQRCLAAVRLLRTNRRYRALYALATDGDDPDHLARILPLEHRGDLLDALERYWSGQADCCYYTFNRLASGTIAPVQVRIQILPGAETDWTRLLVAIEDLSHWQHLERDLQASQMRYAAVVEAQTDLVCRFTPDGRLTFVNRAYAEAVGQPPAQLLGRSHLDFVDADHRDTLQRHLATLGKSGPPAPYCYQTAPGDGVGPWQQWLATPLADGEGRIYEIQAVGRDIAEFKQLEAALRQSETRLQLILNSTQEGIAHAIHDGVIVYVNDRLAQMLGYPREALLQKTLYQLTHPEDHQACAERYDKRSQGQIETYEIRLIHREGHDVWCRVNATPIFEGSVFQGTLGTITDITEGKRATQALQRSEARLRLLLDSAQEGIWYLVEGGRTRYANGRMAAILGCTLEELQGATVYDFLAPQDQLTSRQRYLEERRKGIKSHYELNFIRKDGRSISCFVSATPVFEEGQFSGTLAMIYDITGQKDAEQALRYSEECFALAIAASRDGVWTWCLERASLWWSPQLYQLLGYSAEELSPSWTWYRQRLHPDDRPHVLPPPERHRHSPLPRELEYRIRHRNGDYRWFLSRSIGVHDAEGRLKRVVGIVGDVTERRQLEERRFHANKLETLGQLAGQIAHDFNNLLQVIVGNLQLAEESVPLADAHRSLIGDSLAAARSGAELTRQMLAFSRRQPLHASPLALDEFLEGFTRLAQRLLPETVTLTIHHRVPGLVFAVDRHQLESALLNLVLNARDALADGGGIDLIVASEECVAEETPPSWGEQLRPGPYLRFQVSDHGCGMAEDTLNRALEPFFSTKGDGGSGLGLSSAFGFARQAGGDLRLHSRPGAGTDAIIYLPRKTVNGAPARDIPRVPPPGNAGAFGQPLGRGERILVVEDRHDLRRFALRALKTLGYAPSGVEDAEGAREMLANGEPFHLVLADIRLPGAMDGLALGQWLRQHRPDIPVLYSTGHSEQIHQIASHQLLPKPYGLNQLAQALRRALG